MLEVVLIDDEKIVLNGMAAILRKEEGIHLAGIADNGVEGLSMILEKKPDIVLTDIRMPGMTGLELIKQAKMILPDTVFVIFSGFNEFRYVKQAIGLGVVDYLEKPITVSKLREVFDKAKKICSYKKSYIKMTGNLEKAERVYVEKALRELYEQTAKEEEGLKQVLLHNEELEYARAICVLKIVNVGNHSIEDYRSIVQSLTFDLIQEQKTEVYSFYEHDNLVLTYFDFTEEFSLLEKAKQQKQKLENMGISCYVGVSRIHDSFYEMRNAFVEADNALRYAQYLEETEVVGIESVEYANYIPKDLNSNQNSMEFNFRLGQYETCRKQISEYLLYLKQLDLSPELFLQKCLELVFLLKRLIDEMGDFEDASLGIAYDTFGKTLSVDTLIEWTMDKAGLVLGKAEENGKDGKSAAVRFAKQYIEGHFQESLSLDSVAQEVHMSATYLSMLFKKEEGITYIRYLTKVRLEKSMGYLRQGYKAKQVCEMVGYHDYKYFSSQFKSYTGMTLEAYKKSS